MLKARDIAWIMVTLLSVRKRNKNVLMADEILTRPRIEAARGNICLSAEIEKKNT